MPQRDQNICWSLYAFHPVQFILRWWTHCLYADAFTSTLKCFISLRGTLFQLYYDQGTNFVDVKKNKFKEVLKQCNTQALEAFLAVKHCEFIFNAPTASYADGAWKHWRTVPKVSLGQYPVRLNDVLLWTLFYEAMDTVSSWLLTMDAISNPQTLETHTLNNLILIKSKNPLSPPGELVPQDTYASKRCISVHHLNGQFWSWWKKR